MRDVFVSHSNLDAALAMAVVDDLERGGIRCWIAPRDIPAGELYAGRIVDAIENSRAVLVLLTAAANASNHVLREVECAVNISRRVFVVRETGYPLRRELQFYLAGVQQVSFPAPLADAGPSALAAVVGDGLSAVGGGLEPSDGTARPPRPAPPDDWKTNPFRARPMAAPMRGGGKLGVAFATVLLLLLGLSIAWWAMRPSPEVDAGSLPPTSPEHFNDPTTAYSGTPTKVDVDEYRPKLDPTDVTLQYVNETGHNLRLLLFDCSRHYSGKTAWSDFPFDRGGNPQYYNGFLSGKGWIVFAVRDREGTIHYLGEAKLFDHQENRIVVKNTDGIYVMEKTP